MLLFIGDILHYCLLGEGDSTIDYCLIGREDSLQHYCLQGTNTTRVLISTGGHRYDAYK